MTLYEAVAAENLKAAKTQLEEGADVNQQGEAGKTPLIEAARLGNPTLVKLLLEGGAEPMLKDDEQETALLKAAANGHRPVCALLLPLASDDEQSMARAFLDAFGKTHGPDELPAAASDVLGLTRKAAVYGARAAKFVGYDRPAERVERVERAEDRQTSERPGLKPKK
jgi:ankyrin repeat protein